MDSRYISQLGRLGPSDEVDMGVEGEGVIKNDSKVSGLNHLNQIGDWWYHYFSGDDWE